MRILTRYVLAEFLKVFLVSITGMTLFMLLVGVAKEAYMEGLGVRQIVLLIPYFVPQALLFAVPATTLFAGCSVYGRLASGNEVVAVKASGISPMQLLWPALAFAFLLSLVTVWLNDVSVSWGRQGIRQVVIEAVEEIAYSRLRQSQSYSNGRFAINVEAVDGKRLIHPTFTFQGSEHSSSMTIVCEEATLTSNSEANTLTVKCTNGTLQSGDNRLNFPDTLERVISLDEASGKGKARISPSNLAMADIPEEKVRQAAEIERMQQELAAEAAYQMMTGDFTSLVKGNWVKSRKRLADAQERLYRLRMEPYRRWANGFSCLCFVIVGAPLAIRMRNADFLTSFFMCFLPILIFYYPLMAFGVSQAKSGSFPSWGVWAGNVVLLAIGMQLIRRVCRY